MWIGVPFLENADTGRLAPNNRRYWPIWSGHFFRDAMTRMTCGAARGFQLTYATGHGILSVHGRVYGERAPCRGEPHESKSTRSLGRIV